LVGDLIKIWIVGEEVVVVDVVMLLGCANSLREARITGEGALLGRAR